MTAKIQEKRENELAAVLDLCSKLIALNFEGFDRDDIDDRTRQLVMYMADGVGQVFKSLVELNGVIEDLELSRGMISRYPWHGTPVTKAKHFELTWFLFQNLCYKYKEKLKLYFNAQKSLAELLGEAKPDWLKSELKFVDKVLGPAIRDRGNTVHSWNAKQTEIDFFSTVLFFSNLKKRGHEIDLPEGFFDVDGHYMDAKGALKREASKMIRDANSQYHRILTYHEPSPKILIKKSQDILDAVNSGNSLTRQKAR